ncbi:MAG TPA: hypothetical protein VF432_02585 [Thermoanaerobaculia bacterium]
MGKFNNDNGLNGQRISRSLLAISFAASLAALGCTTNHNIGNGTPTRSGPDVRTAPTSGVTSGGETATPVNPPMTSSYNRAEVLPAVTSRTIRRRSPDEAAAIMAGRQALRGRYLGVVSPGSGSRPYESANIQTYQNPAMLTNPQITINSSISSPATPIDGIADADTLFVTTGTTADATTGAVTTGTTAAATVAGTGTTPTPTAAGAGLPVGAFAGVAASPTFASANTPSVTASSVGLGRTTAARTARTGTATTGTTTAATTGTTAAGVRVGTVTSPVRVMRATSGSVTVTNVGATPTTTGSGRSQ